ncbi:glutamate--cysteine ligase [Streptomyces sp. ICBB 8177]|uniref:carboxylate-amine ligase n=1 Tax=Streptomyces sp. ICBB 8177 TaxID=563922 RepID=UPI000D6847B9|nr:glutamate--cysteine ligase [Streptomyces sp. ICBB 8177]PWI42919.1 carboxylate--amine ligase [Streptomyces sp. ICBB 8177]
MEDAGRTLGVEEEFLLVDPVTRQVSPAAPAVLAAAGDAPGDGGRFHPELLTGQVEHATGVCRDLPELERQLVAGRRRLALAASAHGVRLLASGTAVTTADAPVTAGPRYDRIARRFAGVVTDYHACGCHVHVGVPDRDTAVAVVNHLAPWLPTLLALSANSPFERGKDTGYASWRAVRQCGFPGNGLPPWCGSARAYDAMVERLVECGVLVDAHMTFWFARPSGRLPTVEVRAADAVTEPAEAVLQAAITRALVRSALGDLAAGREAAPVDPQLGAAAVWSAARHGMTGPAVDPLTGTCAGAWEQTDRLLQHIGPALEDTGDLAAVRRGLDGLRRHGTGAERQRRAAARAPGTDPAAAVVDMLIRRTVSVRNRQEWDDLARAPVTSTEDPDPTEAP